MSVLRRFLAVALLMPVAGCGNSTAPSTTTAAPGQAVAADRYLADTVAAAKSVTAFVDALRAVPSPATPDALRSVAPQLDPALERARLTAQRLTAERLADRRLDEQRATSALAFERVLGAMQRVRDAAAAGDAPGASAAADALNNEIDALRRATPERG